MFYFLSSWLKIRTICRRIFNFFLSVAICRNWYLLYDFRSLHKIMFSHHSNRIQQIVPCFRPFSHYIGLPLLKLFRRSLNRKFSLIKVLNSGSIRSISILFGIFKLLFPLSSFKSSATLLLAKTEKKQRQNTFPTSSTYAMRNISKR